MKLAHQIISAYRSLPVFKGKARLGGLLFNRFLNKPTPVSFTAHDGVKYALPNTQESLGIELFINGVYEQKTLKFLQRSIKDGDIYFDVGANIGSMSIPILNRKRKIRYFGFEASPKVFRFLERNLRINNLSDYTLINKIVYKNSTNSLPFYETFYFGKSSLAPTYTTEPINVASISLDEFCLEKDIQNIDWLKIDVQGFELFVFQGMEHLLRQKKIKNILFEFEAWAEEAAELQPGAAKNYLQDAGYDLFSLEGIDWEKRKTKNDKMIWARPRVN